MAIRHGDDASLPPHRRRKLLRHWHHIAAIRSCGSCGNQCGGNVAATAMWQQLWRRCGGDVAAMGRQWGSNTAAMSWQCRGNLRWQRGTNEPLSSCRHHVILMSSLRHRSVVVMSSPCRCDVFVVWSSCCRHVTVMSAPPLPLRHAMDSHVPTIETHAHRLK